jgi:hypothetical protein
MEFSLPSIPGPCRPAQKLGLNLSHKIRTVGTIQRETHAWKLGAPEGNQLFEFRFVFQPENVLSMMNIIGMSFEDDNDYDTG